jgi:hypothetical protein
MMFSLLFRALERQTLLRTEIELHQVQGTGGGGGNITFYNPNFKNRINSAPTGSNTAIQTSINTVDNNNADNRAGNAGAMSTAL